MFASLPLDALHTALDGLSARQRAISDDIANVNTPNYRARTVNFEDSLRAAVNSGENPMTATRTSVTYSSLDGGPNNNNVDLTNETQAGVKTEMAYELVLRATSDRFNLIKSAIKGS